MLHGDARVEGVPNLGKKLTFSRGIASANLRCVNAIISIFVLRDSRLNTLSEQLLLCSSPHGAG